MTAEEVQAIMVIIRTATLLFIREQPVRLFRLVDRMSPKLAASIFTFMMVPEQPVHCCIMGETAQDLSAI
ncbi:hypothetical protein DSECCO2_632670 [anaerobic digester metagenome]